MEWWDEARLGELKELGADSGDFLRLFVREFFRAGGACLVRIRQARESGATPALLAELHGLKGMCLNMGANRAAALSAELEKACRAGEEGKVLALVPELETALRATWEEMRQTIGLGPWEAG